MSKYVTFLKLVLLCKDPSPFPKDLLNLWKVCLWNPPPRSKLILIRLPSDPLVPLVLGSKGLMENSPWNHRSNGKWSLDPKIIFPYWVLSRSSTIACFVSKFFTSIAVCWNVNITIFIFLNFQGSDTKVEKLYLWAAIEEEEYGWTSYGPSLKHNPPH